MGRGRSSFGGSSRGSSSWGGSSRGSSSWSRSSRSSGSRNTVIIWNGGGGNSYYSEGGSSPKNKLPMAVFMCIICCFISIVFIFLGCNVLSEASLYSEVLATSVDNTKSGSYYYTTYEYIVDGRFYRNKSQEGWEFPEIKGKNVVIYYLESNPNVISEENPADLGLGILVIVCGLGFAAGGIISLVVTIVKKKKATANDVVDGGKKEALSSIEEESRCPYCGAKYSSSLGSCPKCGAGK